MLPYEPPAIIRGPQDLDHYTNVYAYFIHYVGIVALDNYVKHPYGRHKEL